MTEALISAANTAISYPCLLGSPELTVCLYNPANPTIYLSLGDALAATGLIFAAYQLADKKWKWKHYILSPYSPFVIWVCCLLAILSAITAALLPQLALANRFSILAYPITWEIISLSLFISGVAYFVVIGLFWRKIFNAKTAEAFYNMTISQISHTEPEVIIGIVIDNLERIVKEANKDTPAGDYANAILECIVSADHTREYLVTKRLDFIFNFFRLVSDHGVRGRGVHNAINGLIKGLFQYENSFLYSQFRYGGLNSLASVYDHIFTSQTILKEIELSICWEAYEYPMRPESKQLKDYYLGGYLRMFETAVKASFDNNFYNTQHFFYNAFDRLDTFCSFIRNPALEKTESINILIRSRLHDIASFLGNDFVHIYTKAVGAGLISEEERTPLFDKYSGRNILGLYVIALVKYLDTLSRFEDHEEARQLSVSAFFQILKLENPLLIPIREAFIERVWAEINRSIEDGGYPALSRIYFNLIDWHDPKNRERQEYEQGRAFLYQKLLHKMQSKEKMSNGRDDKADAHLPPEIKYSPRKKAFEYHYVSSKILIPDPSVVKPSDAPIVSVISK